MTDTVIDAGTPFIGRRLTGAVRSEWGMAFLALLAVVALQFPLIWQRSIHWDEFFHYSQLHELADGTLTRPLQTLHTRLFAWVLDLSGNGIDHVILIRFAMFACELLAAASIAAIAARFTDKTTGLMAAAAYIGGGFVFQHGFSFRADPMAAGLLMASLWMLLSTRLRIAEIATGGFLLGLAAMITIKIVLFAPAFAGIAWLRWNEERRSLAWIARVAAFGLATGVAFVGLYLFHANGLGGDSAAAAKGVVNASAEKMFGFGELPYLIFAAKQVLLAPVLAACVAFFPGTLLRSRYSMHERIALTGLFLPLLTLFFYHNTAPYYYTFMLPPVVAAVSIVILRFRQKFGTALIAGLFLFSAFMLWTKESSEPIRNQRILMAAAEKTFPQTVAYIDFCAFLGTFPKANAFMTPWGIELYKSGYYPSIRQILEKQTVPLVMDNDPMFSRLLATREKAPEFLPEDAAAIRASYIHFWGPYWIAGKEFAAATNSSKFEILVPGPYTLRGAALMIDDKLYDKGEVVELNRGLHRIGAIEGAARLVWGTDLKQPESPAPITPFWTPF